MPTFIVHFAAESSVRINTRPYLDEEEVRVLQLGLPGVTLAIFDNFVPLTDVLVPQGLVINVEIEALGIKEAIKEAEGAASYALSVLT